MGWPRYPRQALENARVADAERVKAAARVKQDADAAMAADKNAAEPKAVGDIAALTQPAGAANPTAVNRDADIPRQLQSELRRVGCNPGAVDGNWDAASQKSLGLFNKNAHTQFDVNLASLDALEGVRGKTARVCPLICDSGFERRGDSCIKITCKAGFELGDDKTCGTRTAEEARKARRKRGAIRRAYAVPRAVR